MTVAELIAHLRRQDPRALVVQSERAGSYSPVGFIEAGLYEASSDKRGHFWKPLETDKPWQPEPGVDVFAVCLWAARWPVADDGETGA